MIPLVLGQCTEQRVEGVRSRQAFATTTAPLSLVSFSEFRLACWDAEGSGKSKHNFSLEVLPHLSLLVISIKISALTK